MTIELIMDSSWTTVRYPNNSGSLQKVIDKALHEGLGVKEDYASLQHNRAYRMGFYDGIIEVYDKENQKFPTGLTPRAEEVLGEIQATHNFQFKIVDDRPDPLMTVDDVPESISFINKEDNEEITLRDYQMEAINSVVEQQDGVLHLSTGCVTADTNILTSEGYKEFSELLEKAGISEDSVEGYKGNPTGLKLINRYGEVEEPTDITVNGIKKTKLVGTDSGNYIQTTYEHPLMVSDYKGEFSWRQVKDINVGDSLVMRKAGKDGYEFSKVISIEEKEPEPTFDFHMPETNSYIAEGIINHNSGKSFTAAGLIKVALGKIHAGERIAFFVHKKDLFKQTYDVLSSALDVRIGRVGSGRHDVQVVNVVMVPTAASALRIDVEKGLRFTPKQMVTKKMATLIAPEYTSGVNQRMLLRNYVMNMELKTKADEAFKEAIEDLIDESESDAKAIFNLNSYVVQYNNLLKEKNEDKFKKKKRMEDFLESIVMGVFDEAHSVQAEGYYTVALACENALMKIGLTGSIDPKNELLNRRMEGVFHNVSSVTKNVEMIERGVLADTEVMIVPIKTTMIDGEQRDITGYDWQDAYDYGVVQNEYRNALIAKVTQMWQEKGEIVLVVVSRIEHGERISELLNGLGVTHRYIHGESEQDFRDETIRMVREGELDVLLSSTIIDEGIDIPNMSVLVNTAGMRSLRQTLQRLGRVIRRKDDGGTARIIDFDDGINKYLFRHSKERIKIYEDEKFPIKYLE